jgi:hypothetical protein
MANSRLLWPSPDEERQRQELMDQMMEARGVDVAAAARVDAGFAMLEAATKCRFCPDEEACRHWLAGEAGPTPSESVPTPRFSAPA